jgi:tryptophan-rich sensory protein
MDCRLVLASTVVPLLLFFTSSVCPVDPCLGSNVPFRPPPAFFGVAWALVGGCLGVAFLWSRSSLARTSGALYAGLVAAVLAWPLVTSPRCGLRDVRARLRWGVWLIALALTFSFACAAVSSKLSRLLLAPVQGWLVFALALICFASSA